MLLLPTAPQQKLKALTGALVILVLAGFMAAGLEVIGDRLVGNQALTTDLVRPLEQLPIVDRSIALLQERVIRRAGNAAAYRDLGLAYLEKGRETADPGYFTRAERALQRSLELNRSDADALVAMASLTLARHQFSDALALGEEARSLAPQKASVYGVLGDALIELGRYEEGFDAIQRMVDLRPSLASYARVSYVRELLGDIPGAVEAMRLAATSGNPASENVAWAFVHLGQLFFLYQADLINPERQYQQALLLRPDYAPALVGLARIAEARGDRDEAIVISQRAAQLMPLPEYIILLGDLLNAAGRAQEAEAQYALVRVMDQLARAAGMDTSLEAALFEADQDESPQVAVEMARNAYRSRPSTKAADTLAWALFRAGVVEEAAVYMREALRLGTPDPLFHYHAAKIALALGDRLAAHQHLTTALKASPHFSVRYGEDARLTLEMLTREVGS